MRSKVVHLDVLLLTETEGAVRVALSEGAVGVWIPKSLVRVKGRSGNIIAISLTERIALQKGLI
jgi:hypothetical protein